MAPMLAIVIVVSTCSTCKSALKSQHRADAADLLQSKRSVAGNLLDFAVLVEDAFDHLFDQIIDPLDGSAAVVTRALDLREQHAAIAATAALGVKADGIDQPPNPFFGKRVYRALEAEGARVVRIADDQIFDHFFFPLPFDVAFNFERGFEDLRGVSFDRQG